MATLTQSYTGSGPSVAVSSTAGIPNTLAVCITDGDGNILGDTGNATLITAVAATTVQTSADQTNRCCECGSQRPAPAYLAGECLIQR